MRKPHVVVLCSPNRNRLEHLTKLSCLRDRFEITCLRIGPGIGGESQLVDHDVEIPESTRHLSASVSVKRIDEIRRPDAVINFSEAYVPLHAEICQHYSLPGPSPAAVLIGRNKFYMRRFTQELGIPVPNFQLVTHCTLDKCFNLQFPVVIKPAIGCSSTLVERFNSFQDLAICFPEIRKSALRVYSKELLLESTLEKFGDFPFVVEELIGGTVQFRSRLPYQVGEISVESIRYRGKVSVLAVHDAPVPSNGPFYEKIVNSTPTRIPPDLLGRAAEYVARIHTALGDGSYVLHTELRTFPDELVLLEFGLRIGGSSIYRSVLNSTSNDFVEILIQLALGEQPVLASTPPLPTITHYFVPQRSGTITSIEGISNIMASKYYASHQVYDDVGDAVQRPPFRNRPSGYFSLRGKEFDNLELEALSLIENIHVNVSKESPTNIEAALSSKL